MSRYFDTPPLVPLQHPAPAEEQIDRLSEKCFAHYEKKSSKKYGSLYVGGLGSVAFLRLQIARYYITKAEQDSKPELRLKASDLLRQGVEACDESLSSTGISSRFTLLEDPTLGTAATKCAMIHLMDRQEEAKGVAAGILRDCGSFMDGLLAPGECEVLYGRAGYLHVILFLRKYLSTPTLATEQACEVIRHILSVGEKTAKQHRRSGMPLLWEWHGKQYLGAAHGVAGILFTLLHFKTEILSLSDKLNRDLLGLIMATIDALNTQYCFRSGNLASSVGSDSDRLVQWCHGAPGHVLLLVKASQIFNDASYMEMAKTICRNVIFPQGLLRKGLGLCHGISGNAYCFLSVYRGMESEPPEARQEFLDMAHHFLKFGLKHLSELERVPDHPYSLYEGLAGFTALLVDMQNPDKSCFPCYEYE